MSHVRKRRKRAHTINILIQEFTCENVPSYHTFFQEYKKEIFSRMIMLLFSINWKHDHWLSSILKDKNIRHVHYIQGPRCLDKSWGWVNDDEPVIFLRKKLCFGLMMFPKAQHLAKTQHSLQYYGLREPPVWYSLKHLQTVFSPSHFPYKHLRCSWYDVLWSMRHVFISNKYTHDLFSDHKQLIS